MSEAIFCFDTATVRFAIYPQGRQGPRIIAAIGEDPLRDLFGATGGGDTLLSAYEAHAARINARALERYGANPCKPVVLETVDFEIADHPESVF